jgi:hypothetical protein
VSKFFKGFFFLKSALITKKQGITGQIYKKQGTRNKAGQDFKKQDAWSPYDKAYLKFSESKRKLDIKTCHDSL